MNARLLHRPLLAALFVAQACGAVAQCPITISNFPYQEGFEAGPAWISGGTGNDWAWGTPAKPTINSAGGGSNAWIQGGLATSFYSNGQQSWLEGPCFDFTNLPFPYVSFKIFWECERTYDGLGFQYSLNQGATWQNVGSVDDPTTCFDQNWFNTTNISNLNLASPRHGWSGRIGPTQGSCAGGQGSAGWVTASHCLAFLAGEPSVKFRFIFGAGTTCNNYDGVAIDDVYIGEAPAEPTLIQYECFNSDFEVNDVQTCADSWSWDFADPASGAANTSTLLTPDHQFSGPGEYMVTFTRNFSCRSPIVTTLSIVVLDLQLTGTDPTCTGGDGSVVAEVAGATLSLANWSTGDTGLSVTGLGAGTYIFNGIATGACPVGGIVVLNPPPDAPQAQASATNATCNGSTDGSIAVTLSAGTPPFTYAWSPSGGTAATATGLVAGTYTCTITDGNACTTSVSATVNQPSPVLVTVDDELSICLGDAITLQAQASGGAGAYTYAWNPDGPNVVPTTATQYSVIATDANGCTSAAATIDVLVGDAGTPTFAVVDTLGCSPHCTRFIADADDGDFTWDLGDGTVVNGGASITHCYPRGGVYDVRLTRSSEGCSGEWVLLEAVHVLQSPMAAFDAVPPVTTIRDPLIVFVNRSSGADSVLWRFGDPLDSTSTEYAPAFAYGDVGCYPVELLVMNANGCTSTAGTLVCVEDEFAAYVPNAFTPNGDGYNDFWGVITTVGLPREFELIVFDRWGGELFRAVEKDDLWDGQAGGEVPTGVYPWTLRLRDTEGKLQERTGHVTLLR